METIKNAGYGIFSAAVILILFYLLAHHDVYNPVVRHALVHL